MNSEQMEAAVNHNWVVSMAQAIGVCNEKGIVIPDDLVKPWLRDACQRIFEGHLLPQIVTTFDWATFNQLKPLTVQDQKSIVDGKPLKVVSGANENGINALEAAELI